MIDKKARKIVVTNCYECKWIVFRNFPYGGPWCFNSDIGMTEILEPDIIPDFCPLQFDG